jgi:alkanesulfonate monooxygenase SsuD/methylene tetrahydromethanopterin reductase-like flavin-dependent oxidoreductase (luciferase family)
VLLAAAAARTSKIHLGPCIAILPLRHPLHSAEDYAMVDAISGGRLEFGIGSGNTEMDYKVFGVTRENDRQRLHEALEIVLKAWGQDHASHRGNFGVSMSSRFIPDRCNSLIRRFGSPALPRKV